VPRPRTAVAIFPAFGCHIDARRWADVRYVAEYLGHENLESTKIYTRVSVEKLRAVHRATHPAGK